MAQPTNSFSTYDAIGNREDLSDVIYNVAPWETPLMSAMPNNKASGTLHEWQTDTLASLPRTGSLKVMTPRLTQRLQLFV
jgi:hypothetical protein